VRNGRRSSCLRQIHMLVDKFSYKNDALSCRQKQQEHPSSTKYSVFSWQGVRENNHAHLRACCQQRGRADAPSPCLLHKLSAIPPERPAPSGLAACPLPRGLSCCWPERMLHFSAPPVCKLCASPTAPRKTPRHQLRCPGQAPHVQGWAVGEVPEQSVPGCRALGATAS